MDNKHWYRHIKRVGIVARTRKNGRLSLGMSFYGGLENGMLIRCTEVHKVCYAYGNIGHCYIDSISRRPTNRTIFGRHLWYTDQQQIVCEGDIVLAFDGCPVVGMPLDYFENVEIQDRMSGYCSLYLVSPRYFTMSVARNRPTELADILRMEYEPGSMEEYYQSDIRTMCYKALPSLTTRPCRPTSINGWPIDVLYVTEEDLSNYKTRNRILESGVLDGHRYATLIPSRPTYDDNTWRESKYGGSPERRLHRSQSFFDALNLEPNFALPHFIWAIRPVSKNPEDFSREATRRCRFTRLFQRLKIEIVAALSQVTQRQRRFIQWSDSEMSFSTNPFLRRRTEPQIPEDDLWDDADDPGYLYLAYYHYKETEHLQSLGRLEGTWRNWFEDRWCQLRHLDYPRPF